MCPVRLYHSTELLRDLENNKFKTVVVLKRDRLSRKFDELLKIKHKFKKYDVKVIYSAPGEFQPDKDDCYSDFIENIIMGISELEPKITRDRTSNGIRIKKDRGEYSLSGNIPFGFASKDDPEVLKTSDQEVQGKYELFPNPREFPIAEKIFSSYFNRNFATTSDFVDYVSQLNTSDRTLSQAQILYMLTNPIYASISRPAKDVELFIMDENTKNYILNKEAVKPSSNIKGFIDKELWTKVALKYLNNKRHYSAKIKNYLFKGLLKCSSCEKNIILSNNYYTCSTKRCTRIRKEVLSNALLRRILGDILEVERIEEILLNRKGVLESEVKSNSLKLSKIQKEKETYLLEFIRDLENEKASTLLKDLINKEKEIIEEIDKLEDKIQYLDDVKDNACKIRELGKKDFILNYLKDELDVDHVQERLHSLIEKVIICGSTKQYDIQEIHYGR